MINKELQNDLTDFFQEVITGLTKTINQYSELISLDDLTYLIQKSTTELTKAINQYREQISPDDLTISDKLTDLINEGNIGLMKAVDQEDYQENYHSC
ncbi:MAG: RNA polymerase sigma factor RpoD [Wolbachia endosymbiont of Ctenocephalides felis wCfeF]|nr:MAG: RNA polymerase sigma factor RpoD [Wolbachia endosymbiont of Ctenocephalides felis wCfeF]